ncbi:MAG: Uma2 family endonuclease [Catenulispora sp.]
MSVAMNDEPPVPSPRLDPAMEQALDGYRLAEEAGLVSGVSLAVWDSLPEDFCHDHELDRGRLIRRDSPVPGHQYASLSIATVLKSAARRAVESEAHPCLRVAQDLDTRLRDVPGATVRKPDVLVHWCSAEGEKLWAYHLLLAVEIVSPSSQATDTGRDNHRTGFESKMTQYASAGIRHYWIVRLKKDYSAIASVQQWRLDADLGVYVEEQTWVNGETADAIRTEVPFQIEATWADLEF